MPDVAERLTERQRRTQLVLRARLIAQSQSVLRFLDLDNLDASWEVIEPLLTRVIVAGNRTSAAIAADYYRQLRAVELPTTYTPVVAPALTLEDITPSLQVTGPSTIRRLLATGREREAIGTALTNVSGTASRLALNGGRSTLVANIDNDRQAVGWYRVTDAKPCSFCAMIASRGPVYHSRSSAGFRGSDTASELRSHWHDHCGCTARPIWSTDTPPSAQAAEFGRIWNESTRGLGGKEARIAFRRAIEGRE